MTTIGEEFARRCTEPSDIVDWLPELYDTVCRYPGATVVELGVRGGNSTTALLAGAQVVGGTLTAVDILPVTLPPVIVDHPACTILLGDDTSPDILKQIPDRIDVLFVDTSHHFLHTWAELDAYMPRVTGVALFHDTELERPDGAASWDPPFPVARALSAWSAANGYTWQNRPGCYGLGVMKAKAT